MNNQSEDFQDGYKNGYAAAMKQMLRTELQANQAKKEIVRPSAPKHNENAAKEDGHFDQSFIDEVWQARLNRAANQEGVFYGH